MEDELQIIKEKRKNILIFCSGLLFIVLLLFFLLNSIANKVIFSLDAAREEYRPLVQAVTNTVGQASENLDTLTGSGVKVLNTFQEEIPQLPEKMNISMDEVKKDINQAKDGVQMEYLGLKEIVETDYNLLKLELGVLKNDIRNDLTWVKSEVEKWRQLIIFIGSVLGLIIFMTSIQDILENTRWLISFSSDLLKKKKPEIESP